MAFRIADSVVRGEIDNRTRNVVCGKIWIAGRAEPITLELVGNAWPDLAGCLLTFRNPRNPIADPHIDAFRSLQRGSIGDLTASRKVRVFDVPLEEAYAMSQRGEKPPEHLANCLYLEWYSEANGRVVIESVDYELTISPPEWRMTPEQDRQRAQQAADGMANFMQRLTDAIEQQQRQQKDPEEEWDEHDYERLMKESDARTDKHMELLDKFGHSEEAEEKIAEEMGWTRDLTEEEAEEERREIEEMNRACEEALDEPEIEPDPEWEGIDWIRADGGRIQHPLQHRCSESAFHFWQQVDALRLDKGSDKDVGQFLSEFQITGAKLAGALTGVARRRDLRDGPFIVAYLKRALDHLHKAQAGLEGAAARNVLPGALTEEARKELFGIREEILRLMDEFRRR